MFTIWQRAVMTLVLPMAVRTRSAGATLWGRRYAVLGQALCEGVAA